MSLNKNALIRYKTIDKCLQNRNRRWTLNDLIEACSASLYEYEGKDTQVSKRTVQLDIQMMRSNKLGYEAPIVVYDKKYYTYSDETYSITDIPLDSMDLDILIESVEMLKQFKDFSLFSELNVIIKKLEDKVYCNTEQKAAIIHIDKNEHLKGLEYLDVIYQSILKKIALNLEYKSFTSRNPQNFVFHPFILKEFNNRWFLVGVKDKRDQILTLALDRIVSIDMNLQTPYHDHDFDADTYYENTVGVTVLPQDQVQDIILKIDGHNAPYVLTKPFHHSQKLIQRHADKSITISLRLHHNYELERLILGFAESIEVIKPRRLKGRIKKQLKNAYLQYEKPIE